MKYVTGSSFTGVYHRLLEQFELGPVRNISPRGNPTWEIKDTMGWKVYDAKHCWLVQYGRSLNPFFAAAEVFWILSGDGSVEWISKWNKNMRSFRDGDKESFNAAYGERLKWYPVFAREVGAVDQISRVVSRLKEDPNTRRAVISLWHPHLDNQDSKDIACTNWIVFRIREGLLHTLVGMRSNDVVWGTPYNMIQMEHLACLVLGEIQKNLDATLQRGSHEVVVSSLHKYEGLYDKTLERMKKASEDLFLTRAFPPWANSEPITFAGLWGRYYSLLDKMKMVDSQDLKLDDIYPNTNNPKSYWGQLETLAILGLLRKQGTERREVIEWAEDHMHPMFSWLVRDFLNPLKF